MTLQEIIAKRKSFSSGSRVTNCVAHMNRPIDQRPEDCHLCHTDMGNFINYVLRVNEFVNELLDEVEKVAVEHSVAADLPTECPHGHGDLIIDHDHVYCDFCKFSASH